MSLLRATLRKIISNHNQTIVINPIGRPQHNQTLVGIQPIARPQHNQTIVLQPNTWPNHNQTLVRR